MCTRITAKKVTVGLALVALALGCAIGERFRLGSRYYALYVITKVAYFALYVVLPVTVLIINVLLVREVRRASINAAANLGLRHQSTSSNSAVPTVMVVATSLVYVILRGSVSITYLIVICLSSNLLLLHCFVIIDAVSHLVYAYNFYVYLITGKQFRSELRTVFCRCSCSSCSSCCCCYYYY